MFLLEVWCETRLELGVWKCVLCCRIKARLGVVKCVL